MCLNHLHLTLAVRAAAAVRRARQHASSGRHSVGEAVHAVVLAIDVAVAVAALLEERIQTGLGERGGAESL